MKKILLTIVAVAMLASFAFAEVSDIDVTEAAPPAVTKWRIDNVRIYAFTETAIVTYRKGWLDGTDFVPSGEEVTVTFSNEADQPETPADETSTEFTDLIQYIQTRIGAGDTLKQSITKAVKIKLKIQ